MKLHVTDLEPVYTQDGHHLGEAHRLHHRIHDINPDLEQYDTYLHVISFAGGESYYIPTDFIIGYVENTEDILLSVTMQEIMNRTWFRLPTFVALGDEQIERLPAEIT